MKQFPQKLLRILVLAISLVFVRERLVRGNREVLGFWG
jgi:hypothetical protein